MPFRYRMILGLAPALVSSLSAPIVVASPATPDSCILANGGDFNACNVGNAGRGDLRYRVVGATVSTPDSCVAANGGDFNACNVANTGHGDSSYASLPRTQKDR